VIKIDNRVEIIVGARDMTKADFADLRARLDEFGKRIATARVDINDKAAQAKLVLLADRFRRLNTRVTPEIDLRGFARAEAQLAAMSLSLDKLGRSSGGGGGLLSWFTAGIPALIKNLGNASAGVTGFASALASSGPVGIGILAALTAAIAALVLALAPVAAAIVPITIGFGALAAVAIPTLTKVFGALTASGKQAATAMKALTPAQREIVREAEPLKDAFHKLAAAVQPQIMQAFATGIKIVKQLMPALEPLLKAAGKAVDYFLHQLLDWLKSPSGQAFIHWLETQGPKDIKDFAVVMWRTAHAVGDALAWIYGAGLHVWRFFHDLWTVWIPTALDIAREYIRLWADKVEISFLSMVNAIIGIMAHLPGPLGAPFRAARADISRELGRIQADVRQAMDNIQSDFNRLHGKTVTIQVGEGIFRKPGPGGGFASGTTGAAPGWAWVGERGPELVRMRGGEQVIPHGQSMALTRGYAGGTGWDISMTFHPAIGAFLATVNRLFGRIENSVIASIRRSMLIPSGMGGNVGSWIAQSLAINQLPSWWGPLMAILVSKESGGNPRAYNPISVLGQHAEGLAQMLPSTFAAYSRGGSIWNPVANLVSSERYIEAVYGNPRNIHGLLGGTYYGYAGGTRRAAPGLAVVGERGPELMGHGPLVVRLEVTGGQGEFGQFMVSWIRRFVRTTAGGDVQLAFGRH
jgi:SLT domain-containing protein